MSKIICFVPGKPAAQGSKRSLGNGIMVESSNRVKPWRTDVREAVAASAPAHWDREAAVKVLLEFRFVRPKSHYTSKGFLTKKAPMHCTTRIGDLDKLVRAVFDAMTSIAYSDDAQIIEVSATKTYAPRDEREGVAIVVERVQL